MRIRTLKLRDAHCKPGVESSFCSILWDHKALHLITASSSDPAISVHDALLPSEAPRLFRHHRDGVAALALSPNSTCLASGSTDHSVKLYKFPGGEVETSISRFTLPVRTIAFNRSGTIVAAAGEDDGIKFIYTIDGTIARVLKGHKGSITSLSFDPLSEYLASMDSTGTAIIWELQSGSIIHTLKGIAPTTGSDISAINMLSWSPDGEMLAIPGLKNNVVMYDRDTAEMLFSLKGDHSQPICFLAWSPNGKYMATSSFDRQVLIWDVSKKQDIDRQKFENRVSCMAWKPSGNALAVIDVTGKYGIMDSIIPSSMKSPTEDIPNAQLKNGNGILFEDEEDDEDAEEASASGSYSEPEQNRKRLRGKFVSDGDSDDDVQNESIPLPKAEKKLKVDQESKENNGKSISRSRSTRPKMQEAFQPGSTPAKTGKRHFMCYNMLGAITTVEHDGYSHIEIDFHDTGIGPRIPSMTDYFGFTIAALNESGSVYANSSRGEKNLCTLMYRPFSSWASNSEWSMRFEDEEVKAVALGSGWVAAATTLNLLRIYSEGGLQKHVLHLDGPIVTAAGCRNLLAIVTHASDCLPSGEQMLAFKVYNINDGTQPHHGRLPLTPGSNLSWLGFSEDGELSAYDSEGCLRIFTTQYGGSWLPIFSGGKGKNGEGYWIVGLNSAKVFCVACKNSEPFPSVVPKPVLTLLDLSFPLASSDLGDYDRENEFVVNSTRLSQLHRRLEEATASGLDVAGIRDEIVNVEAKQDVCLLKLVASCCKGDKLVRATELVKLMSMSKSVRGAINLVARLKLPNLAERFYAVLEEKLLAEDPDHPPPSAAVTNATTFSPSPAVEGKEFAATNTTPFYPSPVVDEKNVAATNTTPFSPSPVVEKLPATKVADGGNQSVDVAGKTRQRQATSIDLTKAKESTKAGLDEIKSGRPSNPFKKK